MTRADRQQLIDLLLILGDGEIGLRMPDAEAHLRRIGFLEYRPGHRSQRLCRADRPVKLGPVVPSDDHGCAALDPQCGQTGSDGPRLGMDLAPGPYPPDAAFLRSDRRPV